MLTFRDIDFHQLSAHLRRDGHIGFTFQLGTEFHRSFNVRLGNGHSGERRLLLLEPTVTAAGGSADAESK